MSLRSLRRHGWGFWVLLRVVFEEELELELELEWERVCGKEEWEKERIELEGDMKRSWAKLKQKSGILNKK